MLQELLPLYQLGCEQPCGTVALRISCGAITAAAPVYSPAPLLQLHGNLLCGCCCCCCHSAAAATAATTAAAAAVQSPRCCCCTVPSAATAAALPCCADPLGLQQQPAHPTLPCKGQLSRKPCKQGATPSRMSASHRNLLCCRCCSSCASPHLTAAPHSPHDVPQWLPQEEALLSMSLPVHNFAPLQRLLPLLQLCTPHLTAAPLCP